MDVTLSTGQENRRVYEPAQVYVVKRRVSYVLLLSRADRRIIPGAVHDLTTPRMMSSSGASGSMTMGTRTTA